MQPVEFRNAGLGLWKCVEPGGSVSGAALPDVVRHSQCDGLNGDRQPPALTKLLSNAKVCASVFPALR